MFLERLEIFGFKSFADRTVFHFDEGITTIVGPNGCGKSNIAEAIRWILGEQAPSSLRTQTMEEIIFNGTEKRRPLGLAEGHLTFNNTKRTLPIDLDEVTISRRIFRSGESEYLINKVPCRLKDITDLFLDTGIGRHAYSLMHQDRVDFILKSKPPERRAIFEEIAGIGKYRARREETLHKLEATSNNLIRLEDILGEIRRQMSSLYREKRKAERYHALKEKIRTLEISMACDDYRRMGSVYEDIQTSLKEVKATLNGLRLEMARLKAKVKKRREEAGKVQDALMASQDRIHELNMEIQSMGEEVVRRQERSHHLSIEIERLRGQIDLLSQKIKESESRREKEITTREGLARELKLVQQDLKEKESSLISMEEERGRWLSTLDGLKEDMIEILTSIARTRNRISSLRENERGALMRREKLKAEMDDLSREVEKKAHLFDKLKESISSLEDEIRSLSPQVTQLEEEIEGKERDLDRIDSDLHLLRAELKSLEAELETLRRVDKDMVGYYAGVKHILSKKDEIGGIEGVVAELIDVPPEYETAIEAALQDSLQAVVTRSVKDAISAIEELRKGGKERVNFLPLDLITPDPPPSPIPNIDSIGCAVDLVKFDASYQKVLFHLLGNVYIVEDLEVVRRRLSKDPKGYIRFVTLSGDLLDTRGVVSGGGQRREALGLLGRKRRINDLKRRINGLNEKIPRFHSEREGLIGQIDSIKGELVRAKERMENLKGLLSLERAKFERTKEEISLGEERLKGLKAEDGVIEKEISTIREEMRSLTQSQNELKEKNRKHQELIGKMTDEINERELLLKECGLQITQFKVRVAALEERLSSLEESIARLDALYNTHIADRKGMDEELKRIYQERKKVEDEILILKKERGALVSKKEAMEKKVEGLRLDYQRMEKEIVIGEEEVLEKNKEIETESERLYQLNLKASELKMKMEGIIEHLSKEYGLLAEEITSYRKEGLEAECAASSLEELRKRIRQIGEVNPMAPKEYDALKTRYDLMNEQREDLLRAEKDLRSIIQQIDKVSRDLFIAAFKEVKMNFQGIFRELFEGGEADLVMTSQDPLTTGIEIVAQPPGKRLQNISLLSGGERALTAIALLFGIFMTKPSPFCVLDEIDAALDDANITRYTKLLKRFSKDSQFFIITHNRRTMEISDVLYGITMEEVGVSKLISVRWKERATG
jgi:chromosome segregation protein